VAGKRARKRSSAPHVVMLWVAVRGGVDGACRVGEGRWLFVDFLGCVAKVESLCGAALLVQCVVGVGGLFVCGGGVLGWVW